MKIKKRKVAPPQRRDALTTDPLVCKILMRTPLNLDAGGGGAAMEEEYRRRLEEKRGRMEVVEVTKDGMLRGEKKKSG